MNANGKIYVIHRDIDTARREFIEQKYLNADLNYQILPAVNGHDLLELRQFAPLIPTHFWGKPDIKPGALGCFLSHRRAWKSLYDSNEPFAIVAEDDSAPIRSFLKNWPKYQSQLERCDILFLNNRIASWTQKTFENINAAISGHENVKRILASPYQAPGGDGYALTREAARELLRLSEKYQCCCGVDWFILASAWDKRKRDVPQSFEFLYLLDRFADEGKSLKAKISGKPLFKLKKGLKSAIEHTNSVPIAKLKAELQSA